MRKVIRTLIDVALDMPTLMLPALLFVSAVSYTAWAEWWL